MKKFAGITAALTLLMITAATYGFADSDALWNIVHGKCVAGEVTSHSPAPCVRVEIGDGEAKGYALLKDLRGVAQYLLIATGPVSGIESPALLQSDTPHYWQAAWKARELLAAKLGKPVPDDDIGLAINSKYRRSQNQFHIHIDCVRADVKQALANARDVIAASWTQITLNPAGHVYNIRRLAAGDLETTDIFKLVADTLPGARDDMASQTVALVGVTFADGPGFYLLEDHSDLAKGYLVGSEELLDHDCGVVN